MFHTGGALPMQTRLTAEPHRNLPPLRLVVPRDRRRSARIRLRLALDVYDPNQFLGRYWTADLSQEGLFLNADRTDHLTNTILRLGFDADDGAFCLRGAAVREVRGQGVGVQLAFWRRGDGSAHAAYRRLIDHHGRCAKGQHGQCLQFAETGALNGQSLCTDTARRQPVRPAAQYNIVNDIDDGKSKGGLGHQVCCEEAAKIAVELPKASAVGPA